MGYDDVKPRFYASKRRYRIKKTAKNEFSAISGIRAIEMKGGSGCILVEGNTIKGMNAARYAYILYEEIEKDLNKGVHVIQTCGVLNCVKKEHLKAEYCPTKSDREYISGYGKVMSDDELAHALHVPAVLLQLTMR